MKRRINYLLPLLLATNPASAAEPVPTVGAKLARLRAEIQALRAQSRQPEPAPATSEPARAGWRGWT